MYTYLKDYRYNSIFANSAGADETRIMRYFIWVFDACQSTYLRLSRMKRVNSANGGNESDGWNATVTSICEKHVLDKYGTEI